MRNPRIRLVLPLLFAGLCAPLPSKQVVPCADFHDVLEAVPHVALELRTGTFESTWDGEALEGCQVAFETNDSTLAGVRAPDFMPDPDTELYRAGWRLLPDVVADGAGSGIHGIRRGATTCFIRWEQAAYIDDGSFVQSDTLTMLIQCGRSSPPPP